MHPQLALIADELAAATTRAMAVTRDVEEARFRGRADPSRWSIAECVDHLNLTTADCLRRIDAALAAGRPAGSAAGRRYRRDLAGWLLCWSLEPPARMRFKTAPPFVPTVAAPRAQVVAEFTRLQGELHRRLEAASGMDLNRLRIRSPFNERLSYNLYSCFRILAVHQRRHLWQAERVLASLRAGARGA